MAIVRLLIMILGLLCIAMGALWIGQGLGIVRWPASSFMINASAWAMYGGLLAAFGLVSFAVGQRLRG
jgi:uncharacterized membrane protein